MQKKPNTHAGTSRCAMQVILSTCWVTYA